ncbi:uncharacterized protein LOC125782590 [Xyrichtys novacula]|uniref:Uncharacterized protein LOC125782590 n=1 Tax=Xyrichtys novacula TaxID=13765 RepID=A0AAV1F9K0_XYRNO|nr:uncharacterized protein LOC125782590 [Xyrichtys novacula]
MFHQVCLLPKDRPLLRFLWRDLKVDEPPRVFEWKVLPYGTTCRPCCATYALQRHATDHCQPADMVRFSVNNRFYIDNSRRSQEIFCLQQALISDSGPAMSQVSWMTCHKRPGRRA